MENKNEKKSVGRPAKNCVRRGFSLEQSIAEQFDDFCEKTARNKTKVVEVALLEYMEKHKSEME